MRRLLISTIAFVLTVTGGLLSPATVEAATPTPTPPACLFDPALAGTGHQIVPITDGYNLDRVTFDAQGRMYVNTIRSVNDSYFADRLRRFTPSGEVDTSFGTNGYVDVPGQNHGYGGRNVVVDSQGRLWFLRTTFTDRLELLRFDSTGRRDTSLPAVNLDVPTDGFEYEGVGALVADGSGVVIAIGVNSVPNFQGFIAHHRVTSTGVVSSKYSPTAPFYQAVFDATADGWVSGTAFLPDATDRGLLWHESTAGVTPTLTATHGSLFALRSSGSSVAALGQQRTGTEPPDARPLAVRANLVGGVGASIVSETVSGPTSEDAGAHLFGSGDQVIGLVGQFGSPADLFVGTLGADQAVTLGPRLANVGGISFVMESVVLPDGGQLVAGYYDLAGDKLSLVRLSPPTMAPLPTSTSLFDQVTRLYRAYFLRPADSGGVAYWGGQRAAGQTLAQVSNLFASSPEFVTRYGSVSNSAFVALVYANVLGRQPDAAGLQFWTQKLDSGAMTRGQVMIGFSESPEFVGVTATTTPHNRDDGSLARLYRAYLERDPELGGFCYWSRRMVGGVSLTSVSNHFANSAEFIAKYGALSDREFVERVYSNVLGRPGDATGIDFWTGRLASKAMTRGQVMIGFSESAENVLRTGTLPPNG